MRPITTQINKINKTKRYTTSLLFLLIITLTLQHIAGTQPHITAQAEEINQQIKTVSQSEVDIMFVIDYSNSMNANDKDGIALQMLEACIDTFYTKKIKVGFVAYNDRILSYSKPVSIKTKNSREKLKTQISSVTRSGSTDIGLALKKAEELLKESQDSQSGNKAQKRKAHIILLSDGEPDLTYSRTGRTIKQCYDDMDEAAQSFKSDSIKLNSIAFGSNFGGETSVLSELSEKTNGSMYTAETPNILIDIFGEIIKENTFSSLIPVSIGISAGKTQTLDLPMKDTYADEANILVVSSSPLQDATILYSGEDITYARSGYYFTCKINSPKNENIKLQVKGKKDQEIKVYLLLYQNKKLNLSIPEYAEKNKEFTYEYYFTDEDKDTPIDNESFYEQFNIKVTAKKDGNDISDQFKKEESFQNNKMITTIKLEETGEYEIKMKASTDHYSMSIGKMTMEIRNNPPTGSFETNIETVRLKDDITFELNNYFQDPNQDSLTYEIIELTGEASENIILSESTLTVTAQKAGNTSFIIRATDPEENSVKSETVHVYIKPLWRHYIGVIIGVILLVCMLIIYYLWILLKRQKVKHIEYEQAVEQIKEIELNTEFVGKLNAYFIKVPEGLEIEPLTFALYQLREKTVTLGQLLEIVELPLTQLDAFNICFKASQNKELILYHTSKSNIMVGTSIICKKLKYSIDYGNKIYITSHDGEYELELHYVSVRN